MTTPLIPLHLGLAPEKNLYAKLESENPTGSLKDRMVSRTIELLWKEGKINSQTRVVEASSGNTGIALAKVGQAQGFPVTICVADSISAWKKEKILAYGAELLQFETTTQPGAEIKAAEALGQEQGVYFFNQFDNPHHLQAYTETLCQELLEQLTILDIQFDVLIGGVGSGASLRAVGESLRVHHNPELQIYAVSPQTHPTRLEGIHPGHLRGDFPIWNSRPPHFEQGRFFIEDQQGISYASLLQQQSIAVGPCSGAVLYTALEHVDLEGHYLLLFSDHSDRYKAYFSKSNS